MQQGDQLVLVAQDPEATPRVHHREGFTVVELHGELDILAFQHTAPLLDALSGEQAPAIVVDLRRTTFCDCSGLGLLARTSRRAAERGGRVLLVCTHPLQRRILALTGLDRSLPPHTTLDEALAAAAAAPVSR
ncbi:putative anti-sigma factor antagonist [Streptomyces albus]|uniref:Anti-sigma factor antagonist n=2 Tax=Streptomyces albus subsp. albus TaxID=67257 RepID=A0A0B5ERG7_STRA4|nr:putative anti-sigma factor antagonist [Streptomyces albus]AOU75053.1 putative anti-sigma factor antagonist [Streptomyces albus]AYN30860.1 hypothetical protein DUI70_0357 [Streptomyces albus]CCD31806.1 anti-sigma-factor antagonist domain-containing protein [Streptomyces albus subsp. albus]